MTVHRPDHMGPDLDSPVIQIMTPPVHLSEWKIQQTQRV